jgi:hypothetical protein
MNSTETSAATEVTNTSPNTSSETTASERFYSQQEFDDALAKMRHAVTKKALKPYEELGDPDELRALKTQAERKQQEESVKRGEFEKVLQDLASKKDAEIARRDSVIREYKIDTPLVSAAARLRAVNVEQVKSLLKSNVRLNSDGEVEVIDNTGAVKYNDRGQPLQVEDLVQTFLTENPHFVSPTPATTNSRSSFSASKKELDIKKLDMKNPEDRKLYAQYRKERGLA